MGRPREFDEATALTRVAEVFWDRGYEGTSIRDLEAEVGLGRGSLYAAFGDKRALYLAALDRYLAHGAVETGELFHRGGSPLATIEAVLVAASGDPRGCFMVTATNERAGCDPEVARRYARVREGGTRAFADLVRHAVALGELGEGIDAQSLGMFLETTVTGMRVATRGGATAASLRPVIDVAMATLRVGAGTAG